MDVNNSESKSCECGFPKRWFADPTWPVEFDERMNEYNLVHDGAKAIMRYCYWCGGRLPDSKRDNFFTTPRLRSRKPQSTTVRTKSMNTGIRLLLCTVTLCVCGCPMGTPGDHYRPHGHQDTTISISPTSDAILFNATGSGGRDLFLLNLINLTVERITDSRNYEVAPSFSPDGTKIVYAAGVPGERADHIFTIGQNGQSPKQLTDADANDTSPRFSPDGSMIVFARDKTYIWGGLAANWENGGVVCVVASDGTGERQLTPDEEFAFAPFFTPDGQSVIYFTTNGCFSTPIDGSGNPTKLGPTATMPNLSADGMQIVFSDGNFSSDHELFTANLDGSHRTQITTSKNGCFHGVWTGDAKNVYFLMEEWPQGSSGHPKSSIWKVKTDGTGQKQISDLSLFDNPMNWKPKKSP